MQLESFIRTIIILFIISFAIAFDAHRNRIPQNTRKDYSFFTNGALFWFIANYAFLIVVLPYYLFRRSKVLNERNKPSISKENQVLHPADEIKKYKELLDDEIITEKEFEEKKEELLNSRSRNP